MSRPKDLLIAALAGASLALGVIAWRQHRALGELAARPQVGTRPAASFTIHAAKGAQLGVVPPTTAAQLPPGFESDLDAFSPPAPPARSPEPAARRRLARLVDNPEFLHAVGLHRQGLLDARFAELFRRLNLREDEVASLKQLLAEKENVVLDIVAINETADSALSPEGLRESIRRAQAQVENAIRDTLGTDRYELYRDYERTLAHRATVAQLEQRLSYSNTPLTPAQAESLVGILANSTPGAASPEVPAVSVMVSSPSGSPKPLLPAAEPTGRVTDEAIARAETVLAPVQVSALRDLQVEQNAALRAAELIQQYYDTAGGEKSGTGLMFWTQ